MSSEPEIFISVDVETAGPIPAEYSLLSIGACSIFDPEKTFACELRPINRNFEPKALEVTGLSLDELYQQFAQKTDHPMAAVFVSALREWRRAFETGPPRLTFLSGIKDRIDKAMSVTIQRESTGVERQLGFLATVGATAPFVGLFGTVWGIMNSFSAIAARHDTTLAVVAPGIAEALFATAMGLLAAIPAVIFYNKFVNEIARYVGRLESFADEFSAILSRQLDEKAVAA